MSLSVRACLPLTQTLPRHTTLQGSTLSPASESRCVRFGRGRLRVPLRCWHYRSFTQDGGYRAGGCTRCHHAPLSTLLLSTVHPVTLYTPTQPSTVPLQAGRCVLLSHRLHPLTARRPQRCNVNDARRCWCSSDARYVNSGTWGGFGCRIEFVRRVGKHLSAGVLRRGEGIRCA